MSTTEVGGAVTLAFDGVFVVDGARTPFVDYNGALAGVSPIDLGIKAGRAAIARAGVDPAEIGTVVAGNMAQASFDAYFLPRHVGIYCGVPIEVPAHLVQRICGSGIEAVSQAADAVALGRARVALAVGTESMSRNPVAAYTHRGGFRLGQIEFGDFLWESLLDTSCATTMGGTAENLAKRHGISREEVDAFAARSFARALAARADGFFEDEIVPVADETFERTGYNTRAIRLKVRGEPVREDSHVRPSPLEALAKIRPAFGGVQTGGNSSAVVDGAAAVVLASHDWVRAAGARPLARVVAAASVGVPPEIMGIGPVPAIRAVCAKAGVALAEVGRIEINEAFGAQVMACARELGLDEDKLNVNGGAIAIGHPLGATGVRLVVTVARELRRRGLKYGIASACIGGGQGIAMLVENPAV
ncbi:thiolase family protein [Blastochloris viridis]|uniref:3-ketoacyl-CoA thiolase n=1 Tax=Blastochloris viridis TaxID=1079 RepID=A0A0H5BHM1_BLAVI|nr:thiolase family protein [Blastochloris viridis]ALK09459.1 Acetyl-CoA acetyltransferase [Blastochloris viridis]BAS00660.1 3-ketoacyl-CoA thiolase [Blastochloris viridis]CUU42122.1 Acetyl-CoA acetyltransferase [Blastochloris viridis]